MLLFCLCIICFIHITANFSLLKYFLLKKRQSSYFCIIWNRNGISGLIRLGQRLTNQISWTHLWPLNSLSLFLMLWKSGLASGSSDQHETIRADAFAGQSVSLGRTGRYGRPCPLLFTKEIISGNTKKRFVKISSFDLLILVLKITEKIYEFKK